MTDLPIDIQDHLNIAFANRPDLGMVSWCDNQPGQLGSHYAYEETLAIAVMMLRGWTLKGAATLVDRDLIRAIPYVRGYEGVRCGLEDYMLSVGYVQLSDGSVWEIIADFDVKHAASFAEASTAAHRCVSTRNLHPTDEDVLSRVGHLLNLGKVNDQFGFVAEQIRDPAPV